MKNFNRWFLHPFLFGLYPALTLLNHNIAQIKPAVAGRSLLATLVAVVVLLGVLRLLMRTWSRAALVTSLILVLFFSYGHVYNALKSTEVMGVLIGRHRFLLPLWGVFLVLGALGTMRLRAEAGLHRALNAIAAVLIALPIAGMLLFEVQAQAARADTARPTSEAGALHLPADSAPPDIYYIILDAYTRQDVLQEIFGYDNQPFLDRLAGMGFQVARCSQSNYSQTELSLASSLNFAYHDVLSPRYAGGVENPGYLPGLIRNSAARQTFEALGYTVVAFETGYYWSQWEDADFYVTPPPAGVGRLGFLDGLNSFEVMLMETSAGLVLTDAASALPRFLVPDTHYPAKRHRERVLNNLDILRRVPLVIESPKFVFAHLIIPHIPFVFGPQGERVVYEEPLDEANYRQGYRDQVEYLNSQIEQIVSEILAQSRTPPVIVLQGDHGPGPVSNANRLAILNAYYLPGGGEGRVYDTISPVNTFRVIFNQYFGGEFPILEDRSYFSRYDDRFLLDPVPNTCQTQAIPGGGGAS